MKNQNYKFTRHPQFKTGLFALAALCLTLLPARADTLKAGVQQNDVLKREMQGLGRSDIKGADPFAGETKKDKDDGGILEAPAGAFDSANPIGGKPLSGAATDEGGGNFNGQNMAPLMEGGGPPQQQQPNFDPQQGGTNQNQMGGDIDKTREMVLAWDAWHKRVAETIYTRFNQNAQMFFKHSPPLACQISYMVASDGRIGNVRILQPSNNPIYNTMLMTVIKSMAGNPVLQYPPNSKRQFVEKSGTFTWNYTGGQGFKYFTGDKERISGK